MTFRFIECFLSQKGIPKSSKIIQDHPKPCKIIQNHPKSSKIIQNHPRPSKIIQNDPKSSNIIQDHQKSSKTIQNHPKSSDSASVQTINCFLLGFAHPQGALFCTSKARANPNQKSLNFFLQGNPLSKSSKIIQNHPKPSKIIPNHPHHLTHSSTPVTGNGFRA